MSNLYTTTKYLKELFGKDYKELTVPYLKLALWTEQENKIRESNYFEKLRKNTKKR